MIGATDVLLTACLPAALAAVLRQALLRLGAGDSAWAIAAAGGFVAGMIGLEAGPIMLGGPADGASSNWLATLSDSAAQLFLRPLDATEWLAWIAIAGAVVGAAAAGRKSPRPLIIAAGAAVAIAIPLRLLWGSVYLTGEWSTLHAAAILGAFSGGIFVAGLLAVRTNAETADDSTRTDGWVRVLATGLSLATLAIVLALSGSLKLGQIAGALAAAVGGALAGGLGCQRRRGLPVGFSTTGPLIAATTGALLIIGVCYSDLRWENGVALAVAITATMAWTPKPARTWWVRPIVATPLLAMAVTIAAVDFRQALAEQQANPYLNWQPPTAGE